MPNENDPRFHVRSLEEALSIFAAERMAGRNNPTFAIAAELFDSIRPMMDKSFTVEHTAADGRVTTIRGVMLYFEAV